MEKMRDEIDLALAPSAVEMADLCGVAATTALIKALGGVAINIPKVPNPKHELVRLLGIEHAKIISHYYGGERINVPRCKITKKIAIVVDVGTTKEIALRHQVTDRYVRMIKNAGR